MSAAVNRRHCLAGLIAVAAAAQRPGQAPFDLRTATALELAAGLRRRVWSARELAAHYLQRIEALNGPLGRFDNNGALNAFIRTYPELVHAAAERSDRSRRRSGWSGIPVALKDVFGIEGQPVTVGTPAYQSFRAPRDCFVWRRWRSAGAVLLGHTQAQRFVTGLTTPQTANPWNRTLIAGGSSGGSAAAVAAGLAPVALGTETAGSLIYPALCCGVTTLKPTHGLLSLAGVYPGIRSYDVAGPLARSAADCAWVLTTLAGVDPEDSETAAQRGQRLRWPELNGVASSAPRPMAGVRFLVSTNERYTSPAGQPAAVVDPRFKQAFDAFLTSLVALGAQIVPVEISEDLGSQGIFNRREARFGDRPARTLVVTADMAAALPARYRWLENASAEEWEIAVRQFRGQGRSLESEQFKEELARLSPDLLRMAQEEREALANAWKALLAQHRCDAHIYLEVGATLPRRAGLEDTPSPSVRRTGVRPNDIRWPVLSMPVSKPADLDVPVSVQVMAPRWRDDRLLAWGMIWQERHPEMIRLAPAAL